MSAGTLLWRVAPIFVSAFLALLVFSRHVKRREHFRIRYAAAVISGALISSFIPLLLYGSMAGFLSQGLISLATVILIYGLIILGTCFCFDAGIWTVMLISSSGYAVQDLTGHGKGIILLLAGKTTQEAGAFLNLSIQAALLALAMAILFVFFRDKAGRGEDYLDNRNKALLSLAVLLVCIGMGRLTNDNTSRNAMAQIAENLYAMLISVMLLLLQYATTANARLTHDVDTMREMMHLQRVQYETNRDHVQMVNEKYHDLHKMLTTLTPYVPREQIERLESEVAGYDAQTHTGIEALDVVLTEKRMQCQARKTLLTCMVDGEALRFVEELDLFTLFSNLLSNAIEAVSGLPEDMERFVTLTVRRTGNMTAIHTENPCAGVIPFEEGMPKSAGDPEWHGFGMRSMERIAEKYGGTLSAQQTGSLFSVDILLLDPAGP